MTWTLEFNSVLRIIDLVYVGHVTGPEMREATTKAIALGKEKGILEVLVDGMEVDLAPSIIDLFELPDKQYLAEGKSRRSRIALVLPKSPEVKKAARFYENACVNRGWKVQSYPNRDDAIEWLKGTDPYYKSDAGDS